MTLIERATGTDDERTSLAVLAVVDDAAEWMEENWRESDAEEESYIGLGTLFGDPDDSDSLWHSDNAGDNDNVKHDCVTVAFVCPSLEFDCPHCGAVLRWCERCRTAHGGDLICEYEAADGLGALFS